MSDQHINHLRKFKQVVTSKRDALDGLIAEIDQALEKYHQASKPQFMEHIAVTGRVGESKIHAADPDSGKLSDHGTPFAGTHYYTSRCGRRYLFIATNRGWSISFKGVMHLDQCQRCVKLLAKDYQHWEESQQAIHPSQQSNRTRKES